MEIKILGTGCNKCKLLEKLVYKSINENNINANITKIENIIEIVKYDVMNTPALVINDEIILSGRIPKNKELKKILEKYKNN